MSKKIAVVFALGIGVGVIVAVDSMREKPCRPSATRSCSTESSDTGAPRSVASDNHVGDGPGKIEPARIPDPDYEDRLPKFIQADFIELDKIESISLFRSGVGHDSTEVPSIGETCRSKKHYFSPTMEARGGWEADRARKALDQAGEPIPPPDDQLAAKVYSPVDGVVTTVAPTHWGLEIAIRPDSNPEFRIRISHVFAYPDIKEGMSVAAGRRIAFTANSTDMLIEWNGGSDSNAQVYLVSYFAVMPDSIFEAYRSRGVTSREQLVVSREWRDAHPFKCVGTEFAENYEQTRPEDTNFVLTPLPAPVP